MKWKSVKRSKIYISGGFDVISVMGSSKLPDVKITEVRHFGLR